MEVEDDAVMVSGPDDASGLAAFHPAGEGPSTSMRDQPRPSTSREPQYSAPSRHGEAKLGYFLNRQSKVEANNTFVLVLHYDFVEPVAVGSSELTKGRRGDALDISNLKETFKLNRHCLFESRKSLDRKQVLDVISKEGSLKEIFKTKESPEVLIVIILSHGFFNGEIILDTRGPDKEYEKVYTSEIVGALEKVFRRSLKIVLFGACRGDDNDSIFNSLSQKYSGGKQEGQVCRVKSFPSQDNFVLIYATVEGNTAKRDTAAGSWLVQKTCEVLNNLKRDETLVSVLSRIQQKVHEESLKDINLTDNFAQTVEVVYTAHPKFMISRSDSSNLLMFDASKNYFLWKSDEGHDVRGRQAAIFYEDKTKEIVKLHEVLKSELDFDTLSLQNTPESHENFAKAASGGQSEYGCLLVCCFGDIMDKDGELHVKIGCKTQPIGKVVQTFVGPLNEKWAGRPKILFFLQQDITADHLKKKKKLMEIKATLYSGWFVQVLPYQNAARDLIKLLSDPALVENRASLQELAVDMLKRQPFLDDGMIPKISTTLQYLVDFPVWPLKFVSPQLSVVNIKIMKTLAVRNLEVSELRDEFVQSYLQGKDRKYCVYLLSAQAGAGKSTLLKDLTSKFKKVVDSVVVTTQLYSEYKFFEKYRHTRAENLKNFINYSPARKVCATDDALRSKSVIFVLDGFDEVCPDFRENALDLMDNIARARQPLWIATRPEEENIIIDKLRRFEILKVQICPLNRDKQEELLRVQTKWNPEQIGKFLDLHERVGAKDLLENPFHLSLICKSESQTAGLTEVNLYELYENIIKMYLTMSPCIKVAQDHPEYDTNLRKSTETLQRFALQHLAMNPFDFAGQQFSDEEMLLIGKSGIVTIPPVKGRPRFEHQTFAEFLLAQKFVSDLEADKEPAVNLFSTRNYRKSVEFIDKFLCDDVKARCKQLQPKILRYLLDRKQDFDEVVKHIVGGAHAKIFNLLKPKMTFQGGDEARKYISDSKEILEESCNVRSEDLGVALLEMGALDNCPDKLELIKKIASNGCTKMLNKLVTISPNILTNNSNAEPAIHAAEHNRLEMLRVLLTGHRVNVNLRNLDDQTALHKASAEGHIECIKFLFNLGAEMNAVTNQGKTALHLAAENGHTDAVMYLLEKGANPKVEDLEGRNSLHAAFVSESLETVQAFFCERAAFAPTELKNRAQEFLRMAIDRRNADICSFVIESGATRNCIFENGKFVLETVLPKAKKMNSDEDFGFACKIFAKAEKFIKVSDSSGWTMLHWAAKEGNIQAANCLLQSGAQINRKTKEGFTPFLVACRYHKGVRMLQLLLKNGADVAALDKEGNSCFHLACAGSNWPNLKVLFEHCLLFNSKNEDGQSPLHVAVLKKCKLEVLAEFYANRVYFNALDKNNHPPLHYSVHTIEDVIRHHQNSTQNGNSDANKRKSITS